MPPLGWYLIGITAFAVLLTILDKLAAKRRGQRVPETALFVTALLGGSGGMYLAMLFIRHKTKHKRFMLGLPAILLAQSVLYGYLT